jgi:NTE family protein
VVGCSVGALNGAAFCADPSGVGVARLEDLWRGLDAKGLLPSGLVPTAFQLARRGASVLEGNEALRRVVSGVVPDTFEDLRLPFQCVATAVNEAREVWFSSGPLIDAVLASSAIPAIYPAVTIDGVRYIDGAVVNDIPVSRAVDLGARRVYVLHVGVFDRPAREARRPIDVALHAYWIARRHRFHRDLASLPAGVEAVLLPTGLPPVLPYNDFSHSQELMTRSYEDSSRMLAELTATVASGRRPEG